MQSGRACGRWARRLWARSGETPLRRLLDEASAFGESAVGSNPELQWATQPYAERPTPSPPPATDPRHTTVILFPGQGSQRLGMGQCLQDLPAARELYELASSIVGWDVWHICTKGPAEDLEERSQTCVLVTSLAALERARSERPASIDRARAAAGFSLGEITALVFAGSLTFESAVRLVEVRATAMKAAAADRAGGMLTLWLAPDATLPHALYLAREHAAALGVEDPVCTIANYLYPGCKVIAGDEEALKWMEQHGGGHGVKRCVRVRVAGAFHSPLMARAADAMRAAAAAAGVSAPSLPVVSGATGRTLHSAKDVRKALGNAIAMPVRWEQALHALYARPRGAAFPQTLALGPGAVLRATLRQVNARAWDSSIQIDV